MTFNLSKNDILELDDAITGIYKSTLGGGELRQFARLFNNQHLVMALRKILQTSLKVNSNPAINEKLEINVGWIDKRPYAKMHLETNKVEIADGAVFLVHRAVHPGGVKINDSRCILLQAKAVKTQAQMNNPTVSLNPATPPANSTTARELKLLSTWPKFDLYPYAASGPENVLANNIDFQLSPGYIPPHGWFIGTPGVKPSSKQSQTTWVSPWLCGPAYLGASCNETLGSLLIRFFSGGQISAPDLKDVDAGAEFDFKYEYYNDPTQATGYSRLCIEILRAIESETIPDCWTNGAPVTKKQTQILHSNPFHIAALETYTFLRDCLQKQFFTKMPVLLVMRTSTESSTNSFVPLTKKPPAFFLG